MIVVFEKLKAQLSSEEKLTLVKDQASWTEKKGKFFKKEDDCVLLVKQGPAYLLETSEDLEMGTLGMIRNFARVILEDIYNANVLDSCAMAKISSDIAVIKTFIPE